EPRQRLRLDAMPEELALLERQALPGGELTLGRPLDGCVQTRDVDFPVGRLEAAEQPRELLVGVRRSPAEFSGVKVGLGRADGEFRVTQAPQRGVDRRPAG